MKKRWLAVLLTLAMCLSLLPVTAMAEDIEEEEEASLWMCYLGRGTMIGFLLAQILRIISRAPV